MKVLIVDDEYLLRQHIIRSISWEKLGMEVAGEARDSAGALRLVASLRPDIILTDICMPKMNGISLAEKIKKEYPEICVIIVTGYGEFEYAKAAIGAGVFRYLLKPIDAEAYMQVMLEAKRDILEKRAKTQLANAMSDMLKEEQRSRILLRAMIDGGSEYMMNTLEEYGESLSDEPLMVTVFRFEEEHHETAEDIASINTMLYREIRGSVFHDVCAVIFHNTDEAICISNTGESQTSEVLQRCRKLCASHTDLVAGNSGVGKGFGSLLKLYREAIWSLGQRFVSSEERVFVCAAAGIRQDLGHAGIIDSSLILTELRMNDRAKVRDIVEGEFEALAAKKASQGMFKAAVWNILFTLNEFVLEHGSGMTHDIRELSEVIESKRAAKDLLMFSLRMVDEAMDDAEKSRGVNRNEKVELAKGLIAKRYMESGLSLNDVAAALYVNAAYLSSLFKRETGVSMMDYINQLRLGKAKEILSRERDLSIQEIAHMVGYNNEYYFMRCFKKRYGVSPNHLKRC